MCSYLNHLLRGSSSGADPESLVRKLNRLGARYEAIRAEVSYHAKELDRTGRQKLLVGGWFNRLIYLMPIPGLLWLDAWLMTEGLPRTRLDLGLLDFSYNYLLMPLAVVVLELQCRAEFERERTAEKAANLSVSRAVISFILSTIMPLVLLSLFFSMKGGAPLYLLLLPLISWVGHLLLVFDPFMTQGLRSLRRRRDRCYHGVCLWWSQRKLRGILRQAEQACRAHPQAMAQLWHGHHGLADEGLKLWQMLQNRL